jgi:hypothetical protein
LLAFVMSYCRRWFSRSASHLYNSSERVALIVLMHLHASSLTGALFEWLVAQNLVSLPAPVFDGARWCYWLCSAHSMCVYSHPLTPPVQSMTVLTAQHLSLIV